MNTFISEPNDNCLQSLSPGHLALSIPPYKIFKLKGSEAYGITSFTAMRSHAVVLTYKKKLRNLPYEKQTVLGPLWQSCLLSGIFKTAGFKKYV